MLDLLRDPVWQFAGAVLAVFAVGVPLAVFVVQRQRKSIIYDVVLAVPLLTVAEDRFSDLELLFRGKRVEKATLIVVRLQNNGNSPILRSDYETPLSVELDETASVLTAEIIETEPDSLGVQVHHNANAVTFPPAS